MVASQCLEGSPRLTQGPRSEGALTREIKLRSVTGRKQVMVKRKQQSQRKRHRHFKRKKENTEKKNKRSGERRGKGGKGEESAALPVILVAIVAAVIGGCDGVSYLSGGESLSLP